MLPIITFAFHVSRWASCNIHVRSVNEHIDIRRDEALETTLVLFVGPTTHDVFSRNVVKSRSTFL